MKLSKRGEYALRALINLGIAVEVGRSLVQISELADLERIPVKFLEQIMQSLKESGLIASQRGKFGGYRPGPAGEPDSPSGRSCGWSTARSPRSAVSVSPAYERCSCPDEAHCGLRMIMLDVRNAIRGHPRRYTVSDVVGVTLRKMRRDGVPLAFSSPRRPSRAPAGGSGRSGRAAVTLVKPGEEFLSAILPEYSI